MSNDLIEAPAALPTTQDKAKSTANESRALAVARLTEAALLKAGTLELTQDESKELQADFPDSDFQRGAAGKDNLIYIEHAALRDRMNKTLGLGQWAIIVRDTWREEKASAVKVYCRAMLIVRGCYVGEAVGDMDYHPQNNLTNYGDAFEGAKTAAFRRCAKEFGIGLQAWRKDWCNDWLQRNKPGYRPAAAPAPEPRKVDKESGEIREYVAGVVPNGKHAGKAWADVDGGYLKWVTEKAQNAPQDLIDGAKAELERRDAEKAAAEPRNTGPDRDDTRESLSDLQSADPAF